MPEYFFILVFILILAFIGQKRFKLKLYKSSKHMIISNVIFLAIGTMWDQFAIFRGHWSFHREFLLGPKIGFMPIEEFLFIFIVPYLFLVAFRLTEKWAK